LEVLEVKKYKKKKKKNTSPAFGLKNALHNCLEVLEVDEARSCLRLGFLV